LNLQEFVKWLKWLNTKMEGEGRRILLLSDNAPSHKVDESVEHEAGETESAGFQFIKLSHVMLLFLPANTTSHVQLLDAGIIASLKAKYWRHIVTFLLAAADQADRDQKPFKVEDVKITVNQVKFSSLMMNK
jgi:hypothetical protein